jgi:hypothetical protein
MIPSETFLRRALLLPLALPILVSVGTLLAPQYFAGPAVLLVGSLSYGGLAYALFAVAMYWWTRNRPWPVVRRLALLAPVLYAPLAGINMAGFVLLFSPPALRPLGAVAESFLEGCGFALVFGYGYVLLAFAAEGIRKRPTRALALLGMFATPATAAAQQAAAPPAAVQGSFGEKVTVLHLDPGITVTVVAPPRIDPRQRVDLILYALPNGNTTAQTIGRRLTDSLDWHFDIQHIGAQVRMLRTMGYPQAIVAYLEARGLSWPAWRRGLGYDSANTRIVRAVDEVRAALGDTPRLRVTLAGHSGGGSLMFGFIEGAARLPAWLDRIVFLDANYNFEARHAAPLAEWLAGDPARELVVLAYDDRNIMLNGKKVVSDSGGTWRASERMRRALGATFAFTTDTVGEFVRHRAPQVQLLVHPNPENRILHTEMIGEMNGFAHAMLVGRPAYDRRTPLLRRERAYTRWVDTVTVP